MSPKTVKVNQTLAATHNRRLSLRLLVRHGSLSRKQIADMTGMHGSTLSNIMAEFLERGIVREIGKRESSTVGKKQTLVEINPKFGWVLGVGIHENEADHIVMNARGDVVGSYVGTLDPGLTNLGSLLKSVVNHNRGTAGPLLRLGIGIPGIIDSQRGFVVRSEWLDLTGYPLAHEMTEHFNVPMDIDNDVRVSTKAEALLSQADSRANFLYFHSNFVKQDGTYSLSGFGLGMYLDGQVYHGEHFGAGELAGPVLPEPFPGLTEEDMQLIGTPDGHVTPTLMRLPEWLAQRLVPLVTLLDPSEVVVGGNVNWQNERLITMMGKAIADAKGSFTTQFVRVRATRIPTHRVAFGAALTAVYDALLGLYPEEMG